MSYNNLEQACKESTPSVEQPMYPSSPESMSENNYNQPLNRDQLHLFDADQKQQKQDYRQKNTSSLQKVEQASTEEKTRKRRVRTAFTTEQLNELEKVFCDNNYVCRPTRISTASRLNLSEKQVKVWFQNRRMKAKHEKSKIAATNGKKILYPSKVKLSQFVATDAIKGGRVNTSGLSATVHYHQLPPNQDMNAKNDGNCCRNEINDRTAYSGSMPNGNIYNDSPDVKIYNNNNYYYQAVDGFNNNCTNNYNFGYYVNPNEFANYDCKQYNATTEYPANNSNLYEVAQTADQTINSFEDIIPSIEFNNEIDGFNFLSTALNAF